LNKNKTNKMENKERKENESFFQLEKEKTKKNGPQIEFQNSIAGKICIGSLVFSTTSFPQSSFIMAKANSNDVPGPLEVINLPSCTIRDS